MGVGVEAGEMKRGSIHVVGAGSRGSIGAEFGRRWP